MDKQKALDTALGQIERAFGKGSIMKLGQEDAVKVQASFYWFTRPGYGFRCGWCSLRTHY